MAVTKLDISLAARAAGHLYLTTAYVGSFIIGGLAALLFHRPVHRPGADVLEQAALPPFSSQTEVGVALVGCLVGIGLLSALYYARRELNGWAYVIATSCTVLLLALLMAALAAIADDIPATPENFDILASLSFAFLIIIYLVRVLIDYGRLALSGHSASSVPPLRLANEVSKLLRHRSSLVPWVHVPTDPGRTFVYAILFLLSLVGLTIWMFRSKHAPPGTRGAIEDFEPWLIYIACVGVAALGALARRNYAIRADRLLELDNRRPILFLRSFGDDKIWLWGKGIFGKFRRKTIDEAIELFAKRLGPFVAIANPNTQLPHLGAAQTYFSNDTWQNAIARWVQTAQMIVMVAGRTEGLRWELDHILADEGQAKLVIFLPPTLRKNSVVAARWFSENFSHTHYRQDLSAIDPKKVIGIAFREDGLFVVETRRVHRREIDYFVAMQAIIFAMATKTSAQQQTQASETLTPLAVH
jgi:hypothetical protein